MRLNYSEPTSFDELLVVAVPSPSINPMKDIGNLQAVSPEEDRLALLRSAVRDLGDSKKATAWRRVLSSVQVRFKVLPDTKARFEHDVSLREKAVSRARLVGRTTYGRMVEIYNYKVSVERSLGTSLSAADIAQSYRGRQSSASEVVTDSFVDNAITVVSRHLSFTQRRRSLRLHVRLIVPVPSFESMFRRVTSSVGCDCPRMVAVQGYFARLLASAIACLVLIGTCLACLHVRAAQAGLYFPTQRSSRPSSSVTRTGLQTAPSTS